VYRAKEYFFRILSPVFCLVERWSKQK